MKTVFKLHQPQEMNKTAEAPQVLCLILVHLDGLHLYSKQAMRLKSMAAILLRQKSHQHTSCLGSTVGHVGVCSIASRIHDLRIQLQL